MAWSRPAAGLVLAILFILGALLALSGCYDPHKKYAHPLEPLERVVDSEGERAARSAAPFGDELVRYLSGKPREDHGEFILGLEFEEGGFAPRMDTLRDLETLLVIMRDFPGLRIAIEGHTDNGGDAEKNQKLSQWRAEWVERFLVERGIATDRVGAQGFGDTQPVADNETPEGREQNRRLVIRVLNFDQRPVPVILPSKK